MAQISSRAAAGVLPGTVLSDGLQAGSNCWIQGCFSSLAMEARLAGSCRA